MAENLICHYIVYSIIFRSIVPYRPQLKGYRSLDIEEMIYFDEICQFYTICLTSLIASEAKLHPGEAENFLAPPPLVCLVYQVIICCQSCLILEFGHDKFLKKDTNRQNMGFLIIKSPNNNNML